MSKATGMPCADYTRVGGQWVAAFEGTPMTPRDVRMARDAFCEGARVGGAIIKESEVSRRYPMPRVERPREVAFNGARFKVIDGTILCRPTPQHGWYSDTFTRYAYTFMREPQLLVTLFDLILNPIEEVDAE